MTTRKNPVVPKYIADKHPLALLGLAEKKVLFMSYIRLFGRDESVGILAKKFATNHKMILEWLDWLEWNYVSKQKEKSICQ